MQHGYQVNPHYLIVAIVVMTKKQTNKQPPGLEDLLRPSFVWRYGCSLLFEKELDHFGWDLGIRVAVFLNSGALHFFKTFVCVVREFHLHKKADFGVGKGKSEGGGERDRERRKQGML